MDIRDRVILLDGSDWSLAQGVKPGKWMKVEVPGDVRSSLLKAGRIPDPYCLDNSNKSRWVSHRIWWYRKTFFLPRKLQGKTFRLVFKGIAYFAEVWLNGKRLGTHQGGMTGVVFDVTDVLAFGSRNVLMCRLSTLYAEEKFRGLFRPESKQARDHWFSENMGIWKSVFLKYSDAIIIEKPFARPILRKNYRAARVNVSFDIQSRTTEKVTVDVTISPKNFRGRKYRKKIPLTVSPGRKRISLNIDMHSVRLWWPWELGSPSLYEVKICAMDGKYILDAEFFDCGIREVVWKRRDAFVNGPLPSIHDWANHLSTELPGRYVWTRQTHKRRPAKPEIGSYNWMLTVNGREIFVRGASWLPSDILPGRTNAKVHKMLVKSVAQANLNLIRIWGGGIVEKESFYDFCDRTGMMVLQDFPNFRTFQRTAESLEFLRKETEEIAEGLRNHPCIVMWDGGNELLDNGNPPDHPAFSVMRTVCRSKVPDADFRRASPEPPEMHGVWHYNINHYGVYNSMDVPFQSETGCGAFPSFETLKRMLPEMAKGNMALKVWRRYMRNDGDDGYCRYTNRYVTYVYGDAPVPARQMIWASQVVQAEAVRYIYETFRRNQPRCGGVILWQYNDQQPSAFWSLVDWNGNKKLAYYFTKKACEPLILCARFNKNVFVSTEKLDAEIWIVNDSEEFDTRRHTVNMELLDSNGKILCADRQIVRLTRGSSRVSSISWQMPESCAGLVFLRLRLSDSRGKILYTNTYPMQVLKAPEKVLARLLIVSDEVYENDPLTSFLESQGIEVTTAVDTPDNLVIPADSAQDLKEKFNVIMIGPVWQMRKRLGTRQMLIIKEAVQNGCGIFFTGSDINANRFSLGRVNNPMPYGTPLAEISPVGISRHESKKVIKMISKARKRETRMEKASHPVLKGLDWSELPALEVDSLFLPKPGAKILIRKAGVPILVESTCGKGRTMVFSGAYASQWWGVNGFVAWQDAYQFLARNILYAAGKDRKTIENIDAKTHIALFRGLTDIPESRLKTLGFDVSQR